MIKFTDFYPIMRQIQKKIYPVNRFFFMGNVEFIPA